MLSPEARSAYDRNDLADIIFADDTLLLGSCAAHMEEFLRAVASAGQEFGLQLHEGKFQLLQVHCSDMIRNLSGASVPASPTMVYLGASLDSSGRAGSELARRIGMAKADFRSLAKVWRRSNLSMRRKLEIFSALVESKLLYGLSTAVYTKAELRQLDGFQAKCLRRIQKIPDSFVSRVSNATVRQRCSAVSLSDKLADRQTKYLQKVLKTDDNDVRKQVSFVPGLRLSLQAATSRFVRRRGRPRRLRTARSGA